MPELPDVETFRKRLYQRGLGRPVTAVDVRRRDLLVDVGQGELGSALKGAALETTRRHGKHLFARVSGAGCWLRLHFGMTGELSVSRTGGDGEVEPDHTRLRLDFDDGGFLAYVNTRALGEIGLVEDVDAFLEERGLGPDARDLSEGGFAERLAGTSAMLKSALTDQSRIAGLGNVYADEILLRAGLHPKLRARDLDDDSRRRLFGAMREVLDQAVEAHADPTRMPDTFILPDREEGAPCPRCGGTLESLKVSGRTTYVCPSCQQAG